MVPELGGRPVRSVILTTWRSGSTFLGDVLNSHPANFYHYEPLLDHEIVQIRSGPLATAAQQRLENLLRCNYSSLGILFFCNYFHYVCVLNGVRKIKMCSVSFSFVVRNFKKDVDDLKEMAPP